MNRASTSLSAHAAGFAAFVQEAGKLIGVVAEATWVEFCVIDRSGGKWDVQQPGMIAKRLLYVNFYWPS